MERRARYPCGPLSFARRGLVPVVANHKSVGALGLSVQLRGDFLDTILVFRVAGRPFPFQGHLVAGE